MTDLQLWSLIVGVVLPPFISLIQQPAWPRWLRAVVTAFVCLVAGAMTTYLEGGLTGRSVLSSFLVLIVAAWTSYHHFWQPTGISPQIEYATSPGSPAEPLKPGYDAPEN